MKEFENAIKEYIKVWEKILEQPSPQIFTEQKEGVTLRLVRKPGTNTAVHKKKKPKLTQREKEYLSAVVAPFREKVEYVEKESIWGEHQIRLYGHDLWEQCEIYLPCVSDEMPFDGLSTTDEYTLDELKI